MLSNLLEKWSYIFYFQVYSHSNQSFLVDFDTFWFCFGGKMTQITQVSYIILKVIKLTFSYDRWCQLNLSGCTWADGTIHHLYKKEGELIFQKKPILTDSFSPTPHSTETVWYGLAQNHSSMPGHFYFLGQGG